MTNPFEALNISDDEETFQQAKTDQKVKRTHQQKKAYKQQQAQQAAQQPPPATNSAPITTPEYEHHRENAKQVRNTRAPPTPLTKKLGEGHYLDRRSGTGRVDKPRKEGGGWGNIGNVKDELNKDKYIKETPEENAPVAETTETAEEVAAETKPEEPKALTLEEYYKNKGVEITATYEKREAKRAEVNAEWIKKEKLTVLDTKEGKKISERNGQNVVKQSSGRAGLDENLEGLGFFNGGSRPQREERRERQEERKERQEYKGKGKKIIHEEDFPAL